MFLKWKMKDGLPIMELVDEYIYATPFLNERALNKFFMAWEHLTFELITARDWRHYTVNRCIDKRNKGGKIPTTATTKFEQWFPSDQDD